MIKSRNINMLARKFDFRYAQAHGDFEEFSCVQRLEMGAVGWHLFCKGILHGEDLTKYYDIF
jgi:hypothetical protein